MGAARNHGGHTGYVPICCCHVTACVTSTFPHKPVLCLFPLLDISITTGLEKNELFKQFYRDLLIVGCDNSRVSLSQNGTDCTKTFKYHVLDCFPEPALTLSAVQFSLPFSSPITEHYHSYKLNISGTSALYPESLCFGSNSLACLQLPAVRVKVLNGNQSILLSNLKSLRDSHRLQGKS